MVDNGRKWWRWFHFGLYHYYNVAGVDDEALTSNKSGPIIAFSSTNKGCKNISRNLLSLHLTMISVYHIINKWSFHRRLISSPPVQILIWLAIQFIFHVSISNLYIKSQRKTLVALMADYLCWSITSIFGITLNIAHNHEVEESHLEN